MPDPSDEVTAVVSLIGRSLGFDSLPLPVDGQPPALMAFDQAAEVVASGDTMSAPAKLELLAHLSRSPVSRSSLEPIAASLVRPEVEPGELANHVEEILRRVYASKSGEDALGRRTGDLREVETERPAETSDAARLAAEPPAGEMRLGAAVEDELLDALVPELLVTSLSVVPSCEALTKVVGGRPALSLATTVESNHPLADLRAMVDPREWPRCPIQSVFFKSMDIVVPSTPPPPSLRPPDDGWSATLREVVDFSFGLDPTGASRLTTDLRFVYFGDASTAGCTYDLVRSVGDRILVDRGYLLIEDLRSLGVRRTTTLKQVYIRDRPPPPNVCRYWSIAQALVGASCISQPHSG